MRTSLEQIASALCAAALAACSGDPADESQTLHRGGRAEPLTLDPHVAVIQDARFIIAEMFAGLYEPGPDGRAALGLAESVQVSDDGLVWTFYLREAAWSDGTPITAGDVVAGLRRALDPATLNQYPSTLFMIENARGVNAGDAPVEALGARALDARTVELRLDYPAPYLPSVLMLWGQPLPRHAFEAHGEDWIQPENIVVSGPFKLVQWRSNHFIHLTANPRFHAAQTLCLEDVYYYPTVDTASAERRVRNGELDLNAEFSGTNLAFLRERNPELVRIGPGLTMRSITFNTARPPYDDVRVRRALSIAIDRRFIAEEVLAGADEPLFRIVPEGVAGRAEGVRFDFADEPVEARRTEARALLEAAGFGPDNPLRITFHHQPAAGWRRVAPVIQEDWSLIAPWVEAEIFMRDSQLHYDAMRAGDFEAASSGWIPDFDDPYAYLMQWESEAGEINYSRWTDDRYDALLGEAVDTADTARRTDLMGAAEQLFLDRAAASPVFVESTKMLVSPRVEGWAPNPFRLNQSRWLCVE